MEEQFQKAVFDLFQSKNALDNSVIKAMTVVNQAKIQVHLAHMERDELRRRNRELSEEIARLKERPDATIDPARDFGEQ